MKGEEKQEVRSNINTKTRREQKGNGGWSREGGELDRQEEEKQKKEYKTDKNKQQRKNGGWKSRKMKQKEK